MISLFNDECVEVNYSTSDLEDFIIAGDTKVSNIKLKITQNNS